jgi:hypothetical protein
VGGQTGIEITQQNIMRFASDVVNRGTQSTHGH